MDPDILKKHTPEGTQLELFNGNCFVSLVAFRYSETRLMKVRVPFHSTFEEINLRFYVKREVAPNQWRSEVAFTKLFFPKRTLTFVAKQIYKENYETLKMKHQWSEDDIHMQTDYSLEKDGWHRLHITSKKLLTKIEPDSPEHFFSKHYWGTSKIDEKTSTIYRIEHPEWRLHETLECNISFDFGKIFGSEFKQLSDLKPDSVHLFDGSEVIVKKKKIIQ